MVTWLNLFATFSLAVFIPLGLVLFSFLRFKDPQQLQRWLPWLNVWLALLLPAIFQGLTGHFPLWLLTQFLLSLGISFLLFNHSKWGLFFSLCFILIALVGSWERSRDLWIDPHITPGFSKTIQGISLLENKANPYFRAIGKSWHTTPGEQQLHLSFEARALEDSPHWEWYRYHLDYVLDIFIDQNGDQALHVTPPIASERSHYITREVYTGKPLANRSFRATVSLRSEFPQPPSGCGIILQENGGKYRGQCQIVTLGKEWQTFITTWQAPDTVKMQNLRLVLIDFAAPYDVKGLKLEEQINEIWQDLTPLEPAGVVLRPHIANVRRQDLPSFVFTPSTNWQTYTYTFDLTVPDQILSFVLQLQGGTALELRNFELRDSTQQTLRPLAFTRLALWFPQANLAGHTIAMLGLALMVSFKSLRSKSLIFILTPAAIYFTGSRAAFLAAFLGLSWLMLLSFKIKARALVSTLIILVLTSILLWNTELGSARVFDLEDENSVKRVEIWKVAWQGFLEYPWTGIGDHPQSFVNYWRSNPAAPATVADHAHNFWLHFAVTYGLSGLIASLWITLALGVLAWRWSKGQGLGIILAVFFMNFFDYSLFYSSFLCLFILTLNTLNLEYNKPARH